MIWIVKYAVTRVGGIRSCHKVGVPAAFVIKAGKTLGTILVFVTNIGRFVVFGG